MQGGFNGNGREGDVVVGFGGGGGGLGGSGDGQTGEGEANASGGGCEQEEGKEGKKKVKGPPRTSRACRTSISPFSLLSLSLTDWLPHSPLSEAKSPSRSLNLFSHSHLTNLSFPATPR